jgi:hypothetical protein
VLATRLRLQAERLLREIESAPAVDPAALDAALTLLARAREEQQIRRTKKRRRPDPASVPVKRARPELDAETRLRVKETRRKAAHKGWLTRWANQEKPPPWTQEGGAGERALAGPRPARAAGAAAGPGVRPQPPLPAPRSDEAGLQLLPMGPPRRRPQGLEAALCQHGQSQG